jgi:hypothetical protein
MYVVQNSVWVHHILKNIIEIHIALYNNIIKPQIIYNDGVHQVQSNIKPYNQIDVLVGIKIAKNSKLE